VLDIRAEVCPFTFVRTKIALEAMPIGARLRVLVDHEPAVRNIPKSAQEWGQEVVGTEALGDGQWAIDLIKRVR
jgi:tRNA 2-thiouridine synthesizing protein A